MMKLSGHALSFVTGPVTVEIQELQGKLHLGA